MKKYLFIYLFIGWGLAVSGQSAIQSYEYWFNSNTDNKTSEAIASPAASFDLAVLADASHLPDGVNTFTVRFKDDLGIWSAPLTRFFVKIPEQQYSTVPKNIVAWEYRLNNNPFVKQGVAPTTSFVLDEQISTDVLPDGVNTFTVRFKDDLGNWSSPLTRFFVKIPEQQFSTVPKKIVACEYRLNNETTIKQEIAPVETFVLDKQIDASQLPDGMNVFMVRFKDDLGNWSSPLTRFFVKIPQIDGSVSENLIKAYEYRVEDASGNSVAGSDSTTFTFVSLDAPINPALIEFEVALNHVPMGDYTVHFRALDIRNQWSSVLSRAVEKEAMPTAEFSFSGGLCSGSAIQFTNESFDTDSWLWDFGDGDTSTEFEPVHIYAETGDYEVSLTATDSESGNGDAVAHTFTIYPDYETEATIAICASETPYTFGTQQLTASGAYTETFQTVHGCDSVVTLNLTVHPTYNIGIGEVVDFQVNDDFEEDALGTLAGWTIKYNGSGNANQKVVDNISKNGTKSFQLEGRSSWAADLYKPISSTPDKLTIEAWINVSIANAAASGIGLVNYGAASWGARTSRIDFSNGRIRATCTGGAIYDIQPFTPGEWYHVRVEHDMVARVYSVYIDGQKVSGSSGSNTTDVFPMHPAVSQDFFLCAGNATTTRVYFDDVKMYESREDPVAICSSETPYTFGTQQLTESGTYTETFQTIHGCDSVVTLTLIVNPVYNHTIEVIVSENELPFIFGSSEITESGAYVETFVSINGCDSIVTLNLEVASGDISPPEVVCNPYQVKLRQNGKYVLTKTDIRLITAGTFDDFTSYEDLVIDIYPDTFGCSHVGKDVNVLVTVTDLAGNVGECQSVITVYDKTPPVALCRDITLTLDENGQAFITPADIDQGIPENGYPEWAVTNSGKPYGSYDACGVASIALNKYAFDCGDLGQQLVTLEVTDPSGNFSNCVATVTVVDTSPFSIQPVSDIVLEVAPGVCETEIDYPEIAVTGTCGGEVELIEGIGPGGLFPAGTTIETWVATHASGKTDTMSFAVTVIPENDPPTLNPISNIQADEDTPPLNVVLTGISYGNDCWEQEVTVTAESSGISLIEEIVVDYEKGSTTGSLVIYIIPDASGKAEVTVTVEDSENAKVSQSFFVEIHPVNDPPFVVNPVPDQEIIASYVLKLPLNARPGNIFDDIDDEELSFDVTQLGISGLPDWAVVMNDTLYCTPALKDTGCVDMIVTATDASGASAADTFQICVLNYPVGVNNFTVNSLDVELYPNPANDIVNIEINGENPKPVGVTVFTVTGKKVLEKEFYQSNIVSFSMRDHVSGIYFVKIKIENYEKVKKLILNRK